MPFRPGQPKKEGWGRQKGTPNKATAEAHEIMARLGCDPVESMIRIVNDDVPCSTCRGKGVTKYQPAKGGDKLAERTCESCYGSKMEKISPELKGKMLTELAQYKYPKRKAIDLAVSGMETIAERMKRAQARVKGSTGTVENE